MTRSPVGKINTNVREVKSTFCVLDEPTGFHMEKPEGVHTESGAADTKSVMNAKLGFVWPRRIH